MQLLFFSCFFLRYWTGQSHCRGSQFVKPGLQFHVLGEAAPHLPVPLSLSPSQATVSLVPLHLHEAVMQGRDPSSK